MPRSIRLRGGLAALPVVLLCACTDRDALTPELPTPEAGVATIECHVSVARGAMTCADPSTFRTARGVSAARMLGDQEHVKLASSGTSYDSGTQILQSNVTVQNLTKLVMGTDGTTTSGLMVFFASPPATTGGTGTVSVANEDGVQTFISSGQEYFLYNQVLDPFEISDAKLWQFNVPTTVSTFSFLVYVQTETNQGGGIQAMMESVWTGLANSTWLNPGNWLDGAVPDDSSSVSIPAAADMQGDSLPVLAANDTIGNLYVGSGSPLNLGGFTLEVRGTVDATGTVTSGSLLMSGSGAELNGTVPSVRITGGTALQGATKATGAVSVQDGKLNVSGGHPLSIQIP